MANSTTIFNKISTKLSKETDLQAQLAIVVDGAMELIHSDAGTLYSLADDKSLKFEVVLNHSLNINKKAPDIDFYNVPLYKDGVENTTMVVAHCVLQEKTISVDDIYDENSYNFSGTRAFDKKVGYQSHSILTVPIVNFTKKIVGVIQLINAMDDDGNIRVFNDKDIELVNLFVMQTAFTLSSKILIEKQKKLFKRLPT